MTAVVSGSGRFVPTAIGSLFMGCGLALWLYIVHDWRWWTAALTGWLLELVIMTVMLRITAPDDGRATRPDDPKF